LKHNILISSLKGRRNKTFYLLFQTRDNMKAVRTTCLVFS